MFGDRGVILIEPLPPAGGEADRLEAASTNSESDEGREFSVYLDDSFDCVVVWNSIVNLKICICARVIYYLQCFPSDCDAGRLIYETGRKLWRRWPM